MEPVKQPQPKAEPQLEGSRFHSAESQRNVWVITVEPGISRAQILDPAFLAHVAAKLSPYDRIEVRCDDGTLFADLLVLAAERTWAKTHVLSWHDLTTRDVSMTQANAVKAGKARPDPLENFKIEFKGPHKKFCVIRLSDNAIVREEEKTKKDAQLWLDEYLKVTA